MEVIDFPLGHQRLFSELNGLVQSEIGRLKQGTHMHTGHLVRFCHDIKCAGLVLRWKMLCNRTADSEQIERSVEYPADQRRPVRAAAAVVLVTL